MNIEEIFSKNNLVYDRYLQDNITLPYNRNQITIQANETASANIINQKLEFLYNNFLYLYKNSLICSNLLPVSSTAIAGITANSTNFTWYKNLSTSQFIPLSSNNNLTGLDNTNLMHIIRNNSSGMYYAFLCYSNNIKVFKFNDSGTILQNVYNFNEVDPGYSQGSGYGINFVSVSGIASIDNFLYVLDSARCQLVKYNIIGFTTNNNIFNEKLSYIDSIGNFGGKTSKLEFNNPTGLTIINKFIYVLDAGNKCVKKYDIDLNWIQTYRLSVDLLNLTPLDISGDAEGNIFILTSMKLLKYNNSFSSLEILSLENFSNESFKKIIISASESNIFYLITNRNVYKKFTTRIAPIIGKYLLYRYNYNAIDDDINAFAAISDGINDNILLFSRNGNTGKLGFFKDNLNLYDILAQRNFDIYDLKNIFINGDEYLQNWTINKCLAKLIINHMRFRDQIVGKLQGKRDANGNIVFNNTRYLLPSELESIYFQQDLTAFIGANELVTTSVINRCLKFIFNAQTSMANVLNAEIIDIPFYNTAISLS